MTARRIPTYSEIALFRETLIKTRKTLEKDELEQQCNQLVRMEFACLRAIASLSDSTDQELMHKARQRADLEHMPFRLRKRALSVLPTS